MRNPQQLDLIVELLGKLDVDLRDSLDPLGEDAFNRNVDTRHQTGKKSELVRRVLSRDIQGWIRLGKPSALGFATGRFTIGGIPLGLAPPSFKTMAIPTTLLVDENGRIVWIDQADDYRLRSDNGRVMGAIEAAFSEPS